MGPVKQLILRSSSIEYAIAQATDIVQARPWYRRNATGCANLTVLHASPINEVDQHPPPASLS